MAKKASDNQNISCVKKKQSSGFANFALRDSCAFMRPFSMLLRTYRSKDFTYAAKKAATGHLT
jgi:hypothetical protein